MTLDMSTVPLVALSPESKQVISTLLNPLKVIPSENGLPRDWRGLAHLSNLTGEILPLLTSHPDPSTYILTNWVQKQKDTTIKDLQTALEEIDRWDVVDDTLELFEKDAEKYLKRLEKSQVSAKVIENEVDKEILTIDDIYRLKEGLEEQYYDAFLLYSDEDINFATKMVDKLENQYSLKLCLKDRDLIGGITFEHKAVMTLISERCNRLIVIVSSNFLKSRANKFFLNYAQAIGIDKGQRKVIPCLYEKCQLPPQLSYMFILDYNRVGLYNFWEKLRDSVQIASKIKSNTNSIQSDKQVVLLNEKESNHIIKLNDKHEPQESTKLLKPLGAQLLKDNDKSLKTEKCQNECESNNEHNTKHNIKKYNNFIPQKWKKKWTWKTENEEKEYKSITSTVSLPSLENLDRLNTPTQSMEEKQKSRFINKYMKKVLVRS